MWKRFLEQFSDEGSREAINSILSDYEKRLITKRLVALALIGEGMSTKKIERVLWLSRTTIGALKKNFFSGSGVYKSPRSFKKLISKESRISVKTQGDRWLKGIFSDIDLWEVIKNPPRPPGIGLKK